MVPWGLCRIRNEMFLGLRVVRMRCIAVINLVYFYRSVVVVSSVMVRLAIVGMVFVRLCRLYLCLCTRGVVCMKVVMGFFLVE